MRLSSASSKGYVALGVLGFVWGLSFLFFKLAVGDLGPAVVVLVRGASAFVALLPPAFLARRELQLGRCVGRLPALVAMSLMSGVIPWLAISWSELSIPSGLASILNATTPLWTIVLTPLLAPGEPQRYREYLGVLLGLAGIVVLIGPSVALGPPSAYALGALAVLGGAILFGGSFLVQRRYLGDIRPLAASLLQMLIVTAVMAPLALPGLRGVRLEVLSFGAAILLGVVCTAIGFVLFYYMLDHLRPAQASTVTFLIPVTAVIWGILLLHEQLTLRVLFAMTVILAGVYLTSHEP
jgi:drug/metabolite transporter (DMT)-like permease